MIPTCFWRVGRKDHLQKQYLVVVRVQCSHLGSGRQQDDHQCGIDLPVIVDTRVESVGLLGGTSGLRRVVCVKFLRKC